MRVIITSPSLNTSHNISGISAVAQFIASRNTCCKYTHFALGKRDCETRNLLWLFRTLISYARWVYAIVSDKHAIVHFNLALERRSLIRDSPLILLARLFRRRVIIHIHGGEFLAGAGMPLWLKSVVTLTLARGPIIVLSQLEQALLQGRTRDAKIFALPNCIAVEEAKAFERTYPDEEPLTLLFLGRISVSKGIDVLYEALETSKKRGARFRFVMAGTGPAEELYVPKFRELLGEDFDFKGVVAGAEKIEVLKKCNVFVLPSLFEGLPMALLESMAFGLVPITTDVGSISTVIAHGRNGIIVDAHSAGQIVVAIERLSTDKQYMRALSRNSRQRIWDTCRPDSYFKQLNAIYQYE